LTAITGAPASLQFGREN